ncbi:DUF1697 domain-containing protein [Tenacibaculum tangerinum]|uniref:DUF1697 domain-containing protein n=1 Tax=Tenacibaculum tangerinum TaxID=3038772 RepID=A0ABY8L5B0_9FLAO|nr:DUF1697 domain-containing protein [Tenacibaculum tangerinum]WGH75543.1 DUF1697 domain-containing protein [Tenacibaculum tangerinum]
MRTVIILLRGINVSGKNKLPMTELKTLLEELGYHDVKTYIQSGNIVLKTDETLKDVANKIHIKIKEKYSYDVPVLAKEVKEIEEILQNNPYRHVPEKQRYLTFLFHETQINEVEVDAKEDEFTILKDVVYVNAVGGYGKTKLTNNFFERKLKVSATTRNFKTSNKLIELANS